MPSAISTRARFPQWAGFSPCVAALAPLVCILSLATPVKAQGLNQSGSQNSSEGQRALEPEGQRSLETVELDQETRVALARQLFSQGSRAAEEGRWADAVDRFRRAYELVQVPSALFNMGVALRALGKHLEARNAFDDYLRRYPDGSNQETATQYRAEVAARVAILALVGLDSAVLHDIRMDDRGLVDRRQRPMEVEANAGHHDLIVQQDGYKPFIWQGSIDDGERKVITVQWEKNPSGKALRKRPGFWVAVGVAALTTVIVTSVLLQKNAQLDPGSDRSVSL